jgi:hypothetical protein
MGGTDTLVAAVVFMVVVTAVYGGCKYAGGRHVREEAQDSPCRDNADQPRQPRALVCGAPSADAKYIEHQRHKKDPGLKARQEARKAAMAKRGAAAQRRQNIISGTNRPKPGAAAATAAGEDSTANPAVGAEPVASDIA